MFTILSTITRTITSIATIPIGSNNTAIALVQILVSLLLPSTLACLLLRPFILFRSFLCTPLSLLFRTFLLLPWMVLFRNSVVVPILPITTSIVTVAIVARIAITIIRIITIVLSLQP